MTSTTSTSAGVLQRPGDLEHAVRVRAAWWVDLDRHDELTRAQLSPEQRVGAGRRRWSEQDALTDDERCGRPPLLVDGAPDRGDLGGSAAAAAADDPRAELGGVRRELAEVLGRRVWEDDPLAGEARQADVRHHGERFPRVTHLLDRPQGRLRACAVVRADRDDVERPQPLGGFVRADAAQRLGVLVEGEERDDRQRGDGANGVDRRRELLELEERLDGEEVDAPSLQELGLLREERPLVVPVLARVPERPDRPGYEDVAAGDLTRLAGDLHRRFVDSADVVVEIALTQLAAVGAERVRLHELRARFDEAEVEGEDALRGAEIRLLGAAKTRDGARDEDAHAAVGDDRRAGAEPFQEPSRHRGSL